MSECPYHKEQAAKQEEEQCPHLAAQQKKEEEKCPYMAGKATAGDEEKCPMSGKTASSSGKCPYDSADDGDEGECPYLAAKSKGQNPQGKEYFEQKDWSKATNAEFKEHFSMAYNELAHDTASRKGCMKDVAKILMERLGYNQDELDIIGDDVWLMQGTGNPHIHAKLQPGESVVDLGSGFGIDACIMSKAVGPTGRVVGIDLSINELVAAIKRAKERGLRNVDYRLGDIEDPPFEDESVDVVMSNGGFCLVPDKAKSFEGIYRILKPGGRISISCTARLQPLDATKQWPSCMMVFMPIETVDPVLSKCGFTDIAVDMSNANCDVWDEIKKEEGHEAKDDVDMGIHRGDPKYDFLKEMDMNKMFARVTIHAKKPL